MYKESLAFWSRRTLLASIAFSTIGSTWEPRTMHLEDQFTLSKWEPVPGLMVSAMRMRSRYGALDMLMDTQRQLR